MTIQLGKSSDSITNELATARILLTRKDYCAYIEQAYDSFMRADALGVSQTQLGKLFILPGKWKVIRKYLKDNNDKTNAK